ncbi:MAG: chemotaxis protein CheR [Verrucomicrobia bacterium]|nr:chemotaxis protein CheR [Verrucomicrobiota bacterium]
MLSIEEFDRTRNLVLALTGIVLLDRHRELLDRRCRRLGIHAPADLLALLDAAEAGNPVAEGRLIALVTTNFTGFFRHPRHFEIAAQQLHASAGRHGRARAWCAAAATGEEAYSLAMTLIERGEGEASAVSILASDIDQEALAVAERGEYGAAALEGLDGGRRERFMVEGEEASRLRVTAGPRQLVEFRMVNLVGGCWPVDGPFEVVFCRNVLMYLEAGLREGVLEGMAGLLVPEGLLMLDPVEHVGRAGAWFAAEGQGVYRRRRLPASRRVGAASVMTPTRPTLEVPSFPVWGKVPRERVAGRPVIPGGRVRSLQAEEL